MEVSHSASEVLTEGIVLNALANAERRMAELTQLQSP